MEFQKVPKTGEMLNMFNPFWYVPKKVLKTGEMFNMFNMFNPEGKYSMFNPLPILPLRIEHIEHLTGATVPLTHCKNWDLDLSDEGF